MPLRDTFAQRFSELEAAFRQLPYHSSQYSGRYVTKGKWHQWATSAENLIKASFGEASPHFGNFSKLYEQCSGSEDDVASLFSVFSSAKEDFVGGYVFNVDLRVSGEVFGDFVSLARTALSEGHKDVAAVLACAALEDALKRFGVSHGLAVSDKDMSEVINALKGAGLVAGAQKTLLNAMPRIRNIALHAEWGKIAEPDVNSVIGFVEQFLLTKFSDA